MWDEFSFGYEIMFNSVLQQLWTEFQITDK